LEAEGSFGRYLRNGSNPQNLTIHRLPGAIVPQKFLRSGEEQMSSVSPSLIANAPPIQPHGISEPSFPPPRSLAGSPKSALLVEDAKCLSSFLRRYLEEEGYAVRIASSSQEGLRLYRDFGPFNVVLINYDVPEKEGVKTDPFVPQTKGIELALAIRDIKPCQGIILAAFAFRSAAEVPRPPEAMNIPLLIDSYELWGLLEEIEVNLAISTLSRADWLRLQQIAKLLIWGLGRAARGRDWEDLLGEAQCRTLIGAGDSKNGRHWNRKVPFVQHLAGAMKSIVSVWKRQQVKESTYAISELQSDDEEKEGYSPIESLGKEGRPRESVTLESVPLADQRLIEKEEEDRILARFEDDPEASLVLTGLMDDLSKTEIMVKAALCGRKYCAALKRIRLKLTRKT
jgi:CheY-like chemotaxis protein